MEMTVLQRDDDITHVVLAGHLDMTGTEEIDEAFCAVTAKRGRPVIVDLSAVEFLASRGIGLLFLNAKQLMRAGHKMVLLQPQEIVESVLKTSKVEKVMPIAHDLEQAVLLSGGKVADRSGSPEAAAQARRRPIPRKSPAPVYRVRPANRS